MKGQITMSIKEAERILIIEKIINGEKKQKHGAKDLGISTRQIRRMVKRYKREGVKGLIHKSRGKLSNNRIDEIKERKILEIVNEKYYDFGPTFASEKLLENEQIKISKEKLRQIMIKGNLWFSKQEKAVKVYQMRERRAREGELVQIDGSYHLWFEDRGEKCCLIVFIDDATGKLKELYFCRTETTNNYFEAMKSYIKKYGIPLALYSDKHSIFKINRKELNSKEIDETKGLTQFGRGVKELGIELINAKTPQAKGRVERANRTLQDRLIKEMRLAGISTIEEANKFVKVFMIKHNEKFAVMPKVMDNAHKKLDDNIDLDITLCKQKKKEISKNLTIQYGCKIYQIQTKKPGYTMRKQKVIVIENNFGEIEIIYKGDKLNYKIYEKQPKANKVLNSKELTIFLDNIYKQPVINKKQYVPDENHPYKRLYKAYERKQLQTC